MSTRCHSEEFSGEHACWFMTRKTGRESEFIREIPSSDFSLRSKWNQIMNVLEICDHTKRCKSMFKKLLILAVSIYGNMISQTIILPLDHDVYNRIGKSLYSTSTAEHTSNLPLEYSRLHVPGNYDSLLASQRDYVYQGHSWLEGVIFSTHLAQVIDSEYTLSFDFLPDVGLGRDLMNDHYSWTNVRGFQADAVIGNSFSVRMQYFESLAKFPRYISDFVNTFNIVPGQGYKKIDSPGVYDYSHAFGSLIYSPSKYLTIQAGHDKNFIGDGYRSMLLSDIGFSYPYLKLTGYVWNFQYSIMWAQFQDLASSPQLNDISWFKKKYGVFHYLDWNITNRVSLGFFESVIWENYDSTYGYRGFDFQYANPFIFFHPVNYSMGSPDNVLLGLNMKYKILDGTVLYGQLLIDEMTFSEYFKDKGWWGNKYGYQAGLKSYEVFGIRNLSLQAEMNSATPYTYSHRSSLTNYGHYNQSLAHPLGANFYETLAIGNYRIKRFEFRLQLNYARYGDDTMGVNYGRDIFKSYETRLRDYGNYTGQGEKTNLYFSDLRVSYILNPKTNLRLECGVVYRSVQSGVATDNSLIFNIGIKSAFRNLYYDF